MKEKLRIRLETLENEVTQITHPVSEMYMSPEQSDVLHKLLLYIEWCDPDGVFLRDDTPKDLLDKYHALFGDD